MFIICRREGSDLYPEELVEIEEDLFSSLRLHYKYGLALTLTRSTGFVLLFVTIFTFLVELQIWLQEKAVVSFSQEQGAWSCRGIGVILLPVDLR